MARTHVSIPDDILEKVDCLVGRRKRSEFIAQATPDKLAHEQRMKVFEEFAGSLRDVDIPGWESSESAEWVRSLRRPPDEELVERLRETN